MHAEIDVNKPEIILPISVLLFCVLIAIGEAIGSENMFKKIIDILTILNMIFIVFFSFFAGRRINKKKK